MDAVLPMGCSSSCSIFEAFSNTLEWVAKTKLGITEMVHVIDDFMFLANSSEKCAADMKAFIRLCGQLRVRFLWHKIRHKAPIQLFLPEIRSQTPSG